jgi:hypothetical protein
MRNKLPRPKRKIEEKQAHHKTDRAAKLATDPSKYRVSAPRRAMRASSKNDARFCQQYYNPGLI